MTNTNVTNALEEKESIISINLLNFDTKTPYANVPVLPLNALSQIVEAYKDECGLTDTENLSFRNNRTGQETKNSNTTMQEMGLQNGDELVLGHFKLGAPKKGAADLRPGKKIMISLKNENSTKTLNNVYVQTTDPVGPVVSEFAEKLGLDIGSEKVFYINERTRQSTVDPKDTFESLYFQEGDTLAINDAGPVA